MHTLPWGWHPLSSYDALEVKPRHAVFFFPPAQIDGCVLPEEVKTSRELPGRQCTHWHPLQDPNTINTNAAASTGINAQQITAKQRAALMLLANGRADFHAAIVAGANLSTMSSLVKAGLATTILNSGVKQWEITDLGMNIVRASENAAP